MAAIWKETFKPAHKGAPPPDPFASTQMPGFPLPPKLPASLAPRELWRVRVCSFTFEFQTRDQLEVCLAYYRQKIHPSSILPGNELGSYGGDTGERQRWQERLPMYLIEEPKRKRVVAALERTARQWELDRASNVR